MKSIKNQKGITLVSLVVTIIILIILAGVSINAVIGENGIITIAKKAKENVELAEIEEQTKLNELYMQIEKEEEKIEGTISYDAILKLNEFKKKIADYIDDAANGSVDLTNEYEKPNYQTASVETFGNAIKQIVAKVTKLDEATAATAEDILVGKEAWVNGVKVEGVLESSSNKLFIPSLTLNVSGTSYALDYSDCYARSRINCISSCSYTFSTTGCTTLQIGDITPACSFSKDGETAIEMTAGTVYDISGSNTITILGDTNYWTNGWKYGSDTTNATITLTNILIQ